MNRDQAAAARRFKLRLPAWGLRLAKGLGSLALRSATGTGNPSHSGTDQPADSECRRLGSRVTDESRARARAGPPGDSEFKCHGLGHPSPSPITMTTGQCQ